MKSRFEQKLEEAQSQTLDMTPLVDVAFILLIFFIITTAFVRETGVEVDKPSAVSSSQMQKNIVLIAITAGGDVVYNGTTIGVKTVRTTLVQAMKGRVQPLVIQADKSVPTDLLVQVIDQAKLAGIASVSIATVK
ncbi:MAG: biopolymer transporter ExbD [Marinagarivorans sp.]